MNKIAVFITLAMLLITGCAATAEHNGDTSTYRSGLLSFSAEIPVVRPSTRDLETLKADAMELVRKFGRSNMVAYRDMEDGTIKLVEPISDQGWLEAMKRRGRWHLEGWNYDPGTTAHVSMEWANSVGTSYTGRIRFIRNGKEVGFHAIPGEREDFGYYRDMAKLGIFIP